MHLSNFVDHILCVDIQILSVQMLQSIQQEA